MTPATDLIIETTNPGDVTAWLAGFLAARDGRAQEEELYEAAGKANISQNDLREARIKMGLSCQELSAGTPWSRWWWTDAADYTPEQAARIGIGDDVWPYGPNIDLDMRHSLIEWATRENLTLARHSPLCGEWLANGSCPGCDPKTPDSHNRLSFDHTSGWLREGVPTVIVNHPYGLDADDLARLARLADGFDARIGEGGWYGHGTSQVEIWRRS